MLVRNIGIRDISERVSIGKVLYYQGQTKSLNPNKNTIPGKKNTVGIEGNNCRLRHRIRRAVRKTCCFSKCLRNHIKAFRLAFFYINFGKI